MREPRPIWGFGWAGWLLLPLAAVVGWVYVSGFNLQFKLLELINDRLGIQAVFWTVLNPIMHQWFGLDQAGFAWWTVCYALVAIHLHPGRSAWWWVVLVAWAVVRPWLWWRSVAGGGPVVALAMSSGLSKEAAIVLVYGAADLAILWVITRSRLVAAAVVVASGLGAAGMHLGSTFPTAGPAWVWQIPAYVWHGIVGGSMLWWAVRARRLHGRPGYCRACGYDLRGLAEARCPECGGAFSGVASAAVEGAAAGVHSPP